MGLTAADVCTSTLAARYETVDLRTAQDCAPREIPVSPFVVRFAYNFSLRFSTTVRKFANGADRVANNGVRDTAPI
jgi:hypothetical protein